MGENRRLVNAVLRRTIVRVEQRRFGLRHGTPVFIDTKDFKVCNEWPRREHSRKPKQFYELIKRTTGGSRIDIFARVKNSVAAHNRNFPTRFADEVLFDAGSTTRGDTVSRGLWD